MKEEGKDKVKRVLGIYSKLMNGYTIDKAEEAQNYSVNERSIQRDIEDIREYMDMASVEEGVINTVIYDRDARGYRLEKIYDMKLKNGEILAICKILLDSRAFTKREMNSLISRLLKCCVPKANRREIIELIQNEQYHYIELQHRSEFIQTMWDSGKAIREHHYVSIDYQRTKDRAIVKRRIQPVSIMFSEYYFYITAFIDDEKVREKFDIFNDSYPTIYRIDRIKDYQVIPEKFHIPYANRFEEGEFRKRIQFMYGGKLQRVRFTYSGHSVEAILDRLPTAKIESEEEGTYTITAEVFGKGIEMWLRGQGEMIKNIEIK